MSSGKDNTDKFKIENQKHQEKTSQKDLDVQTICCSCDRRTEDGREEVDRYDPHVQGVQERLCFFTNHCNLSLAYIPVSALQSSQRNASVQSLPLAGNFLYNQ